MIVREHIFPDGATSRDEVHRDRLRHAVHREGYARLPEA